MAMILMFGCQPWLLAAAVEVDVWLDEGTVLAVAVKAARMAEGVEVGIV